MSFVHYLSILLACLPLHSSVRFSPHPPFSFCVFRSPHTSLCRQASSPSLRAWVCAVLLGPCPLVSLAPVLALAFALAPGSPSTAVGRSFWFCLRSSALPLQLSAPWLLWACSVVLAPLACAAPLQWDGHGVWPRSSRACARAWPWRVMAPLLACADMACGVRVLLG